MTWNAEHSPSGVFTLKDERDQGICDGAFRPDISPDQRVAILALISEAPDMLAMLRLTLQDARDIAKRIEIQNGGGMAGVAAARQAIPDVYERIDEMTRLIARASNTA